MNLKCAASRRFTLLVSSSFLLLSIALLARVASAQSPTADAKPAESSGGEQIYQTFYLTNATDQESLNDILTDLRNMIPRAKLFGIPAQNAISIRGTQEDVATAQKIIADLDRPRKVYRLTYTISDSGDSQTKDAQHFTLIVACGDKTTFKQGTRVPIVVGSTSKDASERSDVQYMDVGLSINASLATRADALTLRSKVELSSLGEETAGARDPNVRQTVLDGTSTLMPGKPLVLGSLDVPSTSRRQEIAVVAELVH